MDVVKVIGTPLYQWEIGRKVQIFPRGQLHVAAIHFSHVGDSRALVVEPVEENGVITANVPNILLQDDSNIVVYVVDVSEDRVETLRECVLNVNRRAKPDDYVYTETEIRTYAVLDERIKALEEKDDVAGAVESVNSKTGKVVLTATDVGAIPSTGGKVNGSVNATGTLTAGQGNTYTARLASASNMAMLSAVNKSGSMVNSIQLYSDRTMLNQPLAVSSGGHGGKNAAAGRKNLEVDSSTEVDAKIAARMGQITPDTIGAASQTEVIRLSNVKADKTEIPAPYILPTASAGLKGGVKIGDGLQMDGDVLGVKPEPAYELIETITLEEDVQRVERTEEPNGTPYKFKKLAVKTISPPSDKTYDGNVHSYLSNNVQLYCYATNFILAKNTAITNTIFELDGNLRTIRYTAGINVIEAANSVSLRQYTGVANNTDLYLKSATVTRSAGVLAGTVIEIWGVRA